MNGEPREQIFWMDCLEKTTHHTFALLDIRLDCDFQRYDFSSAPYAVKDRYSKCFTGKNY